MIVPDLLVIWLCFNIFIQFLGIKPFARAQTNQALGWRAVLKKFKVEKLNKYRQRRVALKCSLWRGKYLTTGLLGIANWPDIFIRCINKDAEF